MRHNNKKKNNFKVGIDLLGNDNGDKTLLQSVIAYILSSKIEDVDFVLFGKDDLLNDFENAKQKVLDSNIDINLSYIVVKDFISMNDHPILAIRRKKNSSIYRGISFLKESKIDAFISAGNTGALMSAAQTMLPKLPKISRLALIALLPTLKDPIAVVDIGANITCKPHHLLQFAIMGAAFQKYYGNITTPRVGILNIGEEAKKGTSTLREAYKGLKLMSKKNKNITFCGNIEGNIVFDGDIDVLLTDGFTGNVFLKTAEGITKFIMKLLSNNDCDKEVTSKQLLKKQLFLDASAGAILLGTKKIVVKCHGYASPQSFVSSIRETIKLCKTSLPSSLEKFILEK
jgi:phosphate acyltransferase